MAPQRHQPSPLWSSLSILWLNAPRHVLFLTIETCNKHAAASTQLPSSLGPDLAFTDGSPQVLAAIIPTAQKSGHYPLALLNNNCGADGRPAPIQNNVADTEWSQT
eukprot:scaffold34673_cov50-Prasinocladus_malaysianus.AAC.1